MVTMGQIRRLTQQIANAFSPQRIILFGSYAYGTPNEDSDVDLMVIMPCKGDPTQKAVELSQSFDVPYAVDLMVRTPETIRQRVAWNDFFLREIVEKGKILYDAADTGMDRQSGGRLAQCSAGVPGAQRAQL
jgi:uncharacterized protein